MEPGRSPSETMRQSIRVDCVERPRGHRIDIVVGHGLGRTYLKAERDGESPETLLSLPDCR